MVKDSTTSTKRRSKASSENDDNDAYKKLICNEEKEVQSRDADADTELYMTNCSNLRQIVGEIFETKREGKEECDSQTQTRIQACYITTVLKKLNRLDKVRMMAARDVLNAEKQRLDSGTLQLQNEMYEIEHILEELKKCKQIKPIDESIDLIPMDDFVAMMPADKLSEDHPNYKHQLHLARLEHEYSERVKLAKMLDEQVQRRTSLQQEIASKKTKLKDVKPRLAAVVESTKELQVYFGLSVVENREKNKLACHLPDELFLLFCNSNAYSQFSDRLISVKVKGTLSDLSQYNESIRLISNDNNDSEGDGEASEATGEEAFNKHRHRKNTKADKDLEKRKKLMQEHPLSLAINVKPETCLVEIGLNFIYFPNLGIVTVESNVTSQDAENGCAHSVITGESILNELYEGDTGIESPNKINYYQLKQIGIQSFESLVPKLGYAYNWAQKLCGIEFLNTNNYQKRLNYLQPLCVDEVFTKIKRRLTTRAHLAAQLRQLEKHVIPSIPEHVGIPNTSSTTLTKFASTTFNNFCHDVSSAVELVDLEMVTTSDLFYVANLSRSSAILTVYIVIKNDYPTQVPIFFISSKAEPAEPNAINLEAVRDMEREINLRWHADDAESGKWLLSAQIRYLCSIFDVYLESQSNAQYPRTTTFFFPIRARNRSRPFCYRHVGTGYFTQH